MFRAIILLTKGILRNTQLRRNLMMWIMLAAMLMLFLGAWLIPDAWARKHFWLYFLYWAICTWLTIAGLLLAVFDILIIRAAARAMQRRIEQDIAHIDAQSAQSDAKTKGERK